jgi:phosphotransferase system enzyme I (PtsI)
MSSMKIFRGTPVSPGIAEGSIYLYRAFTCDVFESYVPEGREAEAYAAYLEAVKAADAELVSVIASFSAADADKAKIFAAHREILDDEEIKDEIRMAILDESKSADFAVDSVYTAFATLLAKAGDALIAARAADIRDVRNRVVRILHGEVEKNLSRLSAPAIVVAHDLLPSDTATLDRANVLAIVTEVGGTTSHSAILARSYGIPAVLGVPEATSALPDGSFAAVDALTGEVYLSPDEASLQLLREKRAAVLADHADAARFLAAEGRLADGTRIEIGLNIGSAEEAGALRTCDFVGLFRTEFLYMQTDFLPSEEEQFEVYRRVLVDAAGKAVTLRTLDIGGDKTLTALPLPHEENPFLGCRALRLCLRHRELFLTQLCAALRASVFGNLWLMFPMVGSLDDIRAAKEAVAEAQRILESRGLPYDPKVRVGIMIEIPSIAMVADKAAQECDFASVGTNDLCQYLHAADRMNAQTESYYQTFSPAMFRTLRMIFAAFTAAGKPVSVCGELAGIPAAAPVLAGLGLRKFSMNASSVASVKRALSRATLEQARSLAEAVCDQDTEAEVKELLHAFSAH